MNLSIARDRLSYVIKPDSITASQGDFLATHVALKRIHLLNKFDISPSGGKIHSEETVYKQFILNPENRHQFIAVYGQSGTGKSHLIRWFEAKYRYDRPKNEVVLFIRRSDNTLKGTIRQLLETPEVQDIANKDVYDRLVRATVYEDEDKLKGRIYHDFINEIEHDDESHELHLTNVKRKRLTAFLYNEVVQNHLMSSDGPIERIYSKIAENSSVDRDTIAQFAAKDFIVSADLFEDIHRAGADPKAEKMARELMADESGVEDAKRIVDYLNQFVNDVIQHCAGIEPGDFRDIFQDIRKELYKMGKNLTLFIEDVTSFTGVDDALLDALIVEHTGLNASENLCRISSIVGTTSNYLQNNFRDNHKDRITQYIYLPSDAFDEDGIFEFVGRYINAMSLSETTIDAWVNNHASDADYPVHEIKEGKNWETISIDYGKELCLYPFTKNSIRYLYQNGLTKGHQTPRYIIRDIIEPVVIDILNNKNDFPSIKFNLVNVNTTLSYLIHIQIKDEHQADRLLRFLTIWGDGKPNQYTKNGIVYISSVRKDIIDELDMPEIKLSEDLPPEKGTENKKPEIEVRPAAPLISEKVQERINKANAELTRWTNGAIIDISANVGTGGMLRAAQDDICKFLLSAINWQAEGISDDNITKIKNSSVKLVSFENQSKLRTPGFYTMPANWESMNVIMAFIRWREYGAQKWNYPDADFDAYLITSWASQIKTTLVKSVNELEVSNTSYIEAAIAAEIYRMILCGEYGERSLKNFTPACLFEAKSPRNVKTNHTKEWNALVSLLSQKGADISNRETVRQYFNIPQGSSSSMIVLDALNLARSFKKVKTSKLCIPKEMLEVEDAVKPRRDVFLYLKEIVDRVEKVSQAEVDNARPMIDRIYDCFGTDEIDEDDIRELASKTKKFYDEINNCMFSVEYYPTDSVKKNAIQIAKAIKDIGEVLDEVDPLTILMTFSSDPISKLLPLMDLLDQLEKDFLKVDRQMDTRKRNLGDVRDFAHDNSRYTNDLDILNSCAYILREGHE